MAEWDFYGWLAYAGLWIAGIILFADGAIKMASDLRDKVPLLVRLVRSPWWAFAPLFLVFVATTILVAKNMGWIGVGHDSDISSQMKKFSEYKKETVSNKLFLNERVILDGKSFIDCEFHNVTLVYNGTAPFDLMHSKFYGVFLASDSLGMQGMAKLMYELKFLRVPIFVDGKPSAPPSAIGDPATPPTAPN
jgi:hypothetical protein